MSDTPIDLNLVDKRSTRFPPFYAERFEQFREEYNDSIDSLDALDEDEQDVFKLGSASEAHRRLLDLGFAYWVQHGIPFGFAFEPGDLADDANERIECPTCGEDDAWFFRAGAESAPDGLVFDSIRCLSCDTAGSRSAFFTR